jgi:hypothetical protein
VSTTHDLRLTHVLSTDVCLDAGNGSDPGSAGRSSGGAAVVPEMTAGGMRSGSAGSGGLGVPQVPASALLAGALMPPPYPSGASRKEAAAVLGRRLAATGGWCSCVVHVRRWFAHLRDAGTAEALRPGVSGAFHAGVSCALPGGAPMTRAERVDRYREKKARRTDGGAVRYIARQQNAHRCGRVKVPVSPPLRSIVCARLAALPRW